MRAIPLPLKVEDPYRLRWLHRRAQPVTAALTPLGEDEALRETAQELLTDVMNQFGLDPQL